MFLDSHNRQAGGEHGSGSCLYTPHLNLSAVRRGVWRRSVLQGNVLRSQGTMYGTQIEASAAGHKKMETWKVNDVLNAGDKEDRAQSKQTTDSTVTISSASTWRN